MGSQGEARDVMAAGQTKPEGQMSGRGVTNHHLLAHKTH
jgi:hypothetical protein